MFTFHEKFNFKIGQPPDDHSLINEIQAAVKHSIDRIPNEKENYLYRFLNYGEKKGDEGLRNSLSTWLTEDLKFEASPDNLFITNGCSHGLELACSALLREGDNVLIEAPTFFLAQLIFNDHHLNVHSVIRNELDSTLDLELIEKIVVEKNIKAFYIIPTYHNPTGFNLPLNQRNALYNLALKYKFYLFVDDIYEKLYFDYGATRVAPIFYCSDEIIAHKEKHYKELIKDDNNSNEYVISINSFNKLLTPGIRLGWILAHKNVIKKLESIGYIMSGGGVNPFMNQVVRSFIETGGLDKAIQYSQDSFRERIRLCDEILKGSKAYTYLYPAGSYFFWLILSDDIDLDKLNKRLAEEDVVVLFGDQAIDIKTRTPEEVQKYKRRIRLSFARYKFDRLLEGFKLFRSIIDECI